MGTLKNRRMEQQDRARERRFKARQSVQVYDLRKADAERFQCVIADVIERGYALRFGLTRDKGALAIGIYGDGDEPYTVYVKPGESLDEWLEELRETFCV